MVAAAVEQELEGLLERGTRSILIATPVKQLNEGKAAAIRVLQERGYKGVYVSLHRPRSNVASLLEDEGVDTDDLFFIDEAPDAEEAVQKDHYIRITTPLDIDELVWAILTALKERKEKPQFILIDTWKALAIDRPISEQVRFSEFLRRKIKHEKRDRIAILMIASGLASYLKKRQLIAVEEAIEVGEPEPAEGA